MADTPGLRCEVVDPGPVAVVELAGALRLEATGPVRHTVRKLLTEPRLAIVLDLTGVREVDDICVPLFPTLARLAADQQVALIVVTPSARLRESLRPSALLVNVVDSLASALLVAQRPAPDRQAWLRLRPAPFAPATARRFVEQACIDNDQAELSGNAALVADELVGNALRHGGAGAIEVTLSFRRYYLRISVHDPGPPLGEDDYGYGLARVDDLSASWGCTPDLDDRGKLVWADLPLEGGR